MDKLNAMNIFIHIVEKGSLTRAADSLNTSLPTVVRTLSNLEDHLGVRLLNRTTRKIALTQEGQQYLDRCRRIMTEINEAEQMLSLQQTVPQGLVTVSAPVLFGQLHVAPLIVDYLKRYDQTQLKLVLMDRVINLIDEGVDLAVRIGDLEDSSLIAVPVGSIRKVICASPSLLKKVGKIIKPEDLSKLNTIRITAMSANHLWPFKNQNGEIFHVPVTGSFTCNQAGAAIDACIAGLGFGLFMSYQVQQALLEKKLRLVLTEFETDPIPVSIVYHHAKLMSPRIRFCLEWLKENLKNKLTS